MGKREAYLLSLDGVVDQLSSMLFLRSNHGNIQIGATIYTFGGSKPYTDRGLCKN